MLVIKVEVWPGGDESCKKEIGTATIENMEPPEASLSRPRTFADYFFSFECLDHTQPEGHKIARSGQVKFFPRRSPVWCLVQAALNKAFQ